MSEEFLSELRNFTLKVEMVKKLFSEKTGYKNPIKAWRDGKIAQSGFLSNNVKYHFHGIGCAVVFNDYEIDFDMHCEEKIVFDGWRIQQFLSSQRKGGYKDVTLIETEKMLVQLWVDGKLGRMKTSSDQYYLILEGSEI